MHMYTHISIYAYRCRDEHRRDLLADMACICIPPRRQVMHLRMLASALKYYVCVCMYVCMYACMYIRMPARRHVIVYVCMYVCMHACMHA